MLRDIKAFVENANGNPVKVIIKVDCINNNQNKKACDLLIEAGADYVVTLTGWFGAGVSTENNRTIKSHFGDLLKYNSLGWYS